MSSARPIRLNVRNRFKFTEYLDRIVEIIQPNERVARKSRIIAVVDTVGDSTFQ